MENYTFQYGDGGLVLNADADNTLPFVDITGISGLSNAPYRTTERDREGQDGGFADADYEKMRTIVITGTVYADSESLEAYMEDLKANYAPSKAPLPFYFQPPSLSQRVLFCKSYGLLYDWDATRRIGSSPFQATLIAEDPTIYDAVPTVGSTGLASGSGLGRGYNMGFNFGYGIAVGGSYGAGYTGGYDNTVAGVTTPFSNGQIALVNAGNKSTGATIVISGPISNPTILHDISGRQLSFNISILQDQFLTIDLRNRTVMLNGTASRRHLLINTSRWFMLSPGNNSLQLLGNDPVPGEPNPIMTVTLRSAYR